MNSLIYLFLHLSNVMTFLCNVNFRYYFVNDDGYVFDMEKHKSDTRKYCLVVWKCFLFLSILLRDWFLYFVWSNLHSLCGSFYNIRKLLQHRELYYSLSLSFLFFFLFFTSSSFVFSPFPSNETLSLGHYGTAASWKTFQFSPSE